MYSIQCLRSVLGTGMIPGPPSVPDTALVNPLDDFFPPDLCIFLTTYTLISTQLNS